MFSVPMVVQFSRIKMTNHKVVLLTFPFLGSKIMSFEKLNLFLKWLAQSFWHSYLKLLHLYFSVYGIFVVVVHEAWFLINSQIFLTPDFCFQLPGKEHPLTDLESHRPLDARLDPQKYILQGIFPPYIEGEWLPREPPLHRMPQNNKNHVFFHISTEIRIKSIRILWQSWISLKHFIVIYVT